MRLFACLCRGDSGAHSPVELLGQSWAHGANTLFRIVQDSRLWRRLGTSAALAGDFPLAGSLLDGIHPAVCVTESARLGFTPARTGLLQLRTTGVCLPTQWNVGRQSLTHRVRRLHIWDIERTPTAKVTATARAL